MREIKFRLWKYCHRIKSNKFYYLSEPHTAENDIVFSELYEGKDGKLIHASYCDEHLYELEKGEVLQQFTGLKDSKGNNIYEGDIVLFPISDPYDTGEAGMAIVEFRWGAFGYIDTLNKRFDPLYSLMGEVDQDVEAEVIGNIFENPDLIK